jgi:hypothetical protein
MVFACEPGYIGLDTYDVPNQRLVSHHLTFGAGRQARLFRSPHRYIWPAELDLMAQLAGFELEARHADWAGAEFTAESRSHVSVYPAPGGGLAPRLSVSQVRFMWFAARGPSFRAPGPRSRWRPGIAGRSEPLSRPG